MRTSNIKLNQSEIRIELDTSKEPTNLKNILLKRTD